MTQTSLKVRVNETEQNISKVHEKQRTFEGDLNSFDEIDAFITLNPDLAEETLKRCFIVDSCQSFYNSTIEFFSKSRSNEAIESVCEYIITPYIMQLKSSANRLISDALLEVIRNIPSIFIRKVINSVIFDSESGVYQFEILQRLFGSQVLCDNILYYVFEGRTASLEGQWRKELLNYIGNAIKKSPQLPDEILNVIVQQLHTQILHNPNDASRLFIFLLKTQEIKSDAMREIITNICNELPTKMRSLAMKYLET